MRFALEIHAKDFANVLTQFIAIPGWALWKDRLARLDRARQYFEVTQKDFDDAHAIEFELARLHRRQQSTGRLPKRVDTGEFYRIASLSTSVVEMHRQLSPSGKTRLRGMLVDALKTDFRSIEHEMHVATHLISMGFDVEPTDIEGKARFDFLASKNGREIEIECKSVGYDQGRKIHRGDFNALAEKLYPLCKIYVDKERESKLIILSMCERLNTSDDLFSRIYSYVRDMLELGRDHAADCELSMECRTYHPKSLPPDEATLREETEVQLQSHQFHLFLFGDPISAVVFVAHSDRPDQVLTYMYRQMKQASDQFTRSRPAVVCVQVEGVSPDEWQTLGTGSSLQVMTNRYLHTASRSRAHIHSVAYNSTGWLQRKASVVTEHGTVLYFKNAEHPMRDDPLISIFR